MKTIELPFMYPSVFNSTVQPRTGVLLFGPPGTGKTLLARSISSQLKLHFINIKGPELLNQYIGESEKNIREVFRNADQMRPCIIFIDELDGLVPNRGNGNDSNGVMDRIVSSMINEIDSININKGEKERVYVIGATNRPDMID